MNRTTAKRLFNPHRPLFCRRELVEGDKVYQVGEEFPWEKLGLRPEHVLPLFRHRHVGHDRLVDAPAVDDVAPEAQPLTNASGQRLDGPTIEEWVGAGYLPEHYPPQGWASKESPGLTAWRARCEGAQNTLPWDEELVTTHLASQAMPQTPLPAVPAADASAQPEEPASLPQEAPASEALPAAATAEEPATEEPAAPAESLPEPPQPDTQPATPRARQKRK